MRTPLIRLALFVLLTSSVLAVDIFTTGYDARGYALAQATTALSDDVNSTTDNPAGLTTLSDAVVSVNAIPMLALGDALPLQFIGQAALPLGNLGSVGASINFLTLSAGGATIWNQADIVVSYGYDLGFLVDGLSVGAGVSYQFWSVPAESAGDAYGAGAPNVTIGAHYALPAFEFGIIEAGIVLDNPEFNRQVQQR